MASRTTAARRGNRRRDSVLQAAASADRRRTRRRLAWRWLALLTGIPLLLGGLAWGGALAWRALFSENDFFVIRQIEVTTDGSLGRGHILEYAGVSEGMNLFAVDPKSVRDRLMSVPVVGQAQVGRRLPDTLVIDVTERVAVARLGRAGAGSPLAVDAQGHVLGPSSVRASLPVIAGVRDVGLRPGDLVKDPMLAEALQVLDLCTRPELRAELAVATIGVGSEDHLDVGLATGEQVLLSREDMEEKLDKLRRMRREARRRGLDLAVYDMTVERNYVGRPAAWKDPGERD